MAQQIKIPNCKIVFRNLEGRPTEWNKKGGKRDFAVVLDNYSDVETLINMGFPIKYFNKKNDTDPDVPYLRVKVNYRYDDDGKLISPHVYLIENGVKVLLNKHQGQNNVCEVDRGNIDYCDIIINPFYSNVNGQSFLSAYLDSMWVNLVDNEFEQKYSRYEEDDDSMDSEDIPLEDIME